MEQRKLKMTQSDVNIAISNYVKKNFKILIGGPILPTSVNKVLATIQLDKEFEGSGKYRVVFDICCSVADENGIHENEQFRSETYVEVSINEDGEPVPFMKDLLFLTKR